MARRDLSSHEGPADDSLYIDDAARPVKSKIMIVHRAPFFSLLAPSERAFWRQT